MQYYDFEVLKGDETISSERWVGLPNSREAWPKIAEIAGKIDAPGYRIRVNDEWGATVILIGVAAARSTFGFATVPLITSDSCARPIGLDAQRHSRRRLALDILQIAQVLGSSARVLLGLDFRREMKYCLAKVKARSPR